ncbi:hypothetical protein E5C26_20485 [Serratia proteamaculans]|nr:hypothetical protein E5C26_20485 [Serratia proteamaculans]
MLTIMPRHHKRIIKHQKVYIALQAITFLLVFPLGYLCYQIDSLNDITLEIILTYVPTSMILVDYLYQRFEK